jgi:hypothetical protein
MTSGEGRLVAPARSTCSICRRTASSTSKSSYGSLSGAGAGARPRSLKNRDNISGGSLCFGGVGERAGSGSGDFLRRQQALGAH